VGIEFYTCHGSGTGDVELRSVSKIVFLSFQLIKRWFPDDGDIILLRNVCKICQNARRHIAKHSIVHISRCDNLKCKAKRITDVWVCVYVQLCQHTDAANMCPN
jgi:hypothetical protein